MRKWIVSTCSAAAVLLGASPAAALAPPAPAGGGHGCDAQAAHGTPRVSTESGTAGFRFPGTDGVDGQHNESLVRDET